MATELKSFTGSQFIGKIVLADVEFIPSLNKINQLATKDGLKLFVTSSARLAGAKLGGAVVPPASRSNHLVGHAIDMNIQMGATLFNSDKLGNFGSLPSQIKTFLQAIRDDAVLRWGGDFNDPVHIDDGLNLRDAAAWNAKFPIIQAELAGLSQPGSPTASAPRLLSLTRPLMQGEDVRAVQKKLIERGFNVGSTGADGFFGAATEDAVSEFQLQEGLTPVDGIVGAATRKALGL